MATKEKKEEGERDRSSHLFVDIRNVCLSVLHLDEPFLSVPVGDSIAVGEGPRGSHVQGNLHHTSMPIHSAPHTIMPIYTFSTTSRKKTTRSAKILLSSMSNLHHTPTVAVKKH